ncbi:DUF5123 domain-containing protein [Paradesertivirga mongoliensis]|uniref:DUF5123 domain-containing protein n=1 Tax=Paradesertivirga mongoliensis TaxID=2100740 RepID=A0ABW4ZKZ7_9SPHI|nr:DUF5123 domain-containing protein [Pedobacter mongoliensis]
MNIKTFLIGTALLTGILSFSGCKDDVLEEITTLELNQVLSPTGLTAQVVNKTEVKLTWKAMANASSYTVELFQNTDFSGSPLKTFTGITFDQVPYTISGLNGATQHSVRVKGAKEGIEDSKWVTAIFTTEAEQIMLPVASADITKNSVTLKWSVPNEVTHFMIGTTRYDISASEKLAGEKAITGLTPETNYSAVIHNNTAVRGSQSFKTNQDLPTGPNVVIVGTTDDLATMISTASDGKMFVLLQGAKYNTDNLINLPAGVGITIWGQPGPIKPILAFNGINLAASNKTIKFENLDITGYQNDAGLTKRNYIFNQSMASTTDEIIFENCIIRNFVNTPMRLQSTNVITIGKFTVNNCTVFDTGDNNANGTYAFIHSNVATGKVNNISITNSTFHKIGYGFILHNAAPSASVVIENNTFYNVVGDGRYFIDYNAQTIGTFSFKNNILAKTLSPLNTGRGIRYGGTNVVSANNYKTNDFIITSGGPIPNIIDYADTSTALFTSPATGNFRIRDANFAGKSTAGDPRWRL